LKLAANLSVFVNTFIDEGAELVFWKSFVLDTSNFSDSCINMRLEVTDYFLDFIFDFVVLLLKKLLDLILNGLHMVVALLMKGLHLLNQRLVVHFLLQAHVDQRLVKIELLGFNVGNNLLKLFMLFFVQRKHFFYDRFKLSLIALYGMSSKLLFSL